ncbi:MAG: hypothetical protein WKF75_05510 [Singulisphaera sp.]
MDFLNDPDIWPLGEQAQDALLHERRGVRPLHPGRATWLAAVKFAPVLDPLAHAGGFRSRSSRSRAR